MGPATGPPCPPLVEVVVTEELDVLAVPTVRALLDDAIALRPAHLVVDLAACPFVDPRALAMLLDVHRRVWRAGGRLTFRGLSLDFSES